MISRNIKTIIDLALGDGSLRKRQTDTYPIIDMTHSARQKLYAESKADKLRSCGLSVISKDCAGTGKNIGREYYRVYSHQHAYIHTAYKYLYNSGRKAIDKHLLSILDVESFAYYFLDDGGPTTTNISLSKTTKRIYAERYTQRYGLAAMSFTPEENMMFIDWLKSVCGLDAKLTIEKNGHNRIYFYGKDNMDNLKRLILPFTTADMLYKFSYPHTSYGIAFESESRNKVSR